MSYRRERATLSDVNLRRRDENVHRLNYAILAGLLNKVVSSKWLRKTVLNASR